MYPKTVLSFVVLLVMVPLVVGNPWVQRSQSIQPLESVTIFPLEEACVRQGGLCLPMDDCHPSNRVTLQADLCPTQRHLGVECCYI